MTSKQIDPLWLAMSKLRRGKLEECINICNELLAANPGDQVRIMSFNFFLEIWIKSVYLLKAAWVTKCKAVTKQNFIDDIELDEEGVAEMLMDENAMASVPR